MSAFIDRMTGVYRQYGHYIKKKSEYTLVFFLLMGFYAFFNAFIEYLDHREWVAYMITLAVISALYASLFGLLTSGKLKTSQYIFLMAGLGIGIRYMVYNTHFQFYTQMILILIVGVTIHTSKAQMVIVYSFVNAMVIIRAYFLYNLITVGVISENMLSQSSRRPLALHCFRLSLPILIKSLIVKLKKAKS